jgi:hypothetical protein
MSLEIHPARREAVLHRLREFKSTALDLLRNSDYSGLEAERRKFLTLITYGGFHSALSEPSQFDQWKFRAQNLEWSEKEFGWLLAALCSRRENNGDVASVRDYYERARTDTA